MEWEAIDTGTELESKKKKKKRVLFPKLNLTPENCLHFMLLLYPS